jgi:enoyl-CoA hydratase
MSSHVISARTGDVVLVTLNRPGVRNAVNRALAAEFREALAAAQNARCIVITGADPAFCAGLDLSETCRLSDIPSFSEALRSSRVPLIAAVNGAAVTGGLEIALGCDFIIASERACFADTHLAIGIYPGPVMVDLPRRVGVAWAREISLSGAFIDAATALRIGLANHVTPHHAMLDFALERARLIAAQDAQLVQLMRADWDETAGLPIDSARLVHRRYIERGGSRAAMLPGRSPRSIDGQPCGPAGRTVGAAGDPAGSANPGQRPAGVNDSAASS